MPQVQQIERQLGGTANDAKFTTRGLSGLTAGFGQALGQGNAAFGRSTQRRTDREIVQALHLAEKHLQAAVPAIETAARSAASR